MKSYLDQQSFTTIGSTETVNRLQQPANSINSAHARGGSVSTPWAADPAWAEFGNAGVDGAIRGMVDAATNPIVLPGMEDVK